MFIYVIKLALVLAMVCGLAVGALWLLRKSQPHLTGRVADRKLSVVESLALSPMTRLTVVRFGGEILLIAHGRTGVETLARQPAGVLSDD